MKIKTASFEHLNENFVYAIKMQFVRCPYGEKLRVVVIFRADNCRKCSR